MASFDPDRVTTVLCDLDGVVWLAHEPITGSVEAVAALREAGRRVLFVTNNSMATQQQHVDALASIGVPATGDVVSSAMAAASLVERGDRVLVVGGDGIVEAVERRGAVAVPVREHPDASGFDAVLVGLDRRFDYDRLAIAAAAVREGARLVGTNSDPTYPTPQGFLPGGGSILAAVATAADADPVVCGKPHPPMAALIADLLSSDDAPFDPDATLMVGDRPDTDGRFASALDCAFALVRSGVTPPGTPVDEPVTIDVADLAELSRQLVTVGGRAQ